MKKINIYDDCDEIFDILYDKFDLMPAEVVQGLLDDCLDDWLIANYGRGLNESVKTKRKGLTEKMWKYRLKSGSMLRDAIENAEDDFTEVIACIQFCYQELEENGLIDEDDCQEWVDDLDMLDSDDADGVDYELSNLYDLCDNIGVWIEL